MPCIFLKDGTRVQIRQKRGQKLTARDFAELEKFVTELKGAALKHLDASAEKEQK